MHRRDVLLRLMAAAGAPGLAASAAHASPRWQPAFATPPADIPLTAAKVRGRFPDAVAGTLYRNGPAGHDLGGERSCPSLHR